MVESLKLSEVKNFLHENYFANLLAYLRKETMQACEKRLFMDCNNLIQWQCDSLDNSKFMFGVFSDLLKEYMDAEVKPMLLEQTGTSLLQNLANVWGSLVIYAISADRIFSYLNRNYIKSQSLPQIGEQCLRYFQQNIYERIK